MLLHLAGGGGWAEGDGEGGGSGGETAYLAGGKGNRGFKELGEVVGFVEELVVVGVALGQEEGFTYPAIGGNVGDEGAVEYTVEAATAEDEPPAVGRPGGVAFRFGGVQGSERHELFATGMVEVEVGSFVPTEETAAFCHAAHKETSVGGSAGQRDAFALGRKVYQGVDLRGELLRGGIEADTA